MADEEEENSDENWGFEFVCDATEQRFSTLCTTSHVVTSEVSAVQVSCVDQLCCPSPKVLDSQMSVVSQYSCNPNVMLGNSPSDVDLPIGSLFSPLSLAVSLGVNDSCMSWSSSLATPTCEFGLYQEYQGSAKKTSERGLARMLFSPGCRETEDWPSHCPKLDSSTDRLALDITGSFDTSNIRHEEHYTPSPTYNKASTCYSVQKFHNSRCKISDRCSKPDDSIKRDGFDVTATFDTDNLQVEARCLSPADNNIVKCCTLEIPENVQEIHTNDSLKIMMDSNDSLINSSSLKLDGDVSMEMCDVGSCVKQGEDHVMQNILLGSDCDIPDTVKTTVSDIISVKTENCHIPTEHSNSMLANDINSSHNNSKSLNNNVKLQINSSPEKPTLDSTLNLFLESSLTKQMPKRRRPPINKKRKMSSRDISESPSQTLSGSLLNPHDCDEKRPMCSTPKIQSILSSEKKNKFGSASKRVRFAGCPDVEEDTGNVVNEQLPDNNHRCHTQSVSKYQKSSWPADNVLKINSECLLNGKFNHKMAHFNRGSAASVSNVHMNSTISRSDDDMFSQISPDALEHMMVSVTEPASFNNFVRNCLHNSKSQANGMKLYSLKSPTSSADVVPSAPNRIVSEPEKRTIINKRPIKQENIYSSSNFQTSAMQITPIKSVNDDMFTQISPDAVDSLLNVVESYEKSQNSSANTSSGCLQKDMETQNPKDTSEVKRSIRQNLLSPVHCNNDAKISFRDNDGATGRLSSGAKEHKTNKLSKVKQSSFSHRRKVARFSYPSGSQIKHTHPESVFGFKPIPTIDSNHGKSRSVLPNDDVLESNKCLMSINDDSVTQKVLNNDVDVSADTELHAESNKSDKPEHNDRNSPLPLPVHVIANRTMNGTILRESTSLVTVSATIHDAAPSAAMTKIARRKPGFQKFSDIVKDCQDLWDESFSDPSYNNPRGANESASALASSAVTRCIPDNIKSGQSNRHNVNQSNSLSCSHGEVKDTKLDVMKDDKDGISTLAHIDSFPVSQSGMVSCVKKRIPGIKSGNLHSGSSTIPVSKVGNSNLELSCEKMDLNPVTNRANSPSAKDIVDMNSLDCRASAHSKQNIPSSPNTGEQHQLNNDKKVTHIGFKSAKGCALVSPKSLNMAKKLVSEVDEYYSGADEVRVTRRNSDRVLMTSKNLVLPSDRISDSDDGNSDVFPINVANQEHGNKTDNIGFSSAKGRKLTVTAKSLTMARKLVSEEDSNDSDVRLSINVANKKACYKPDNIGFTSANGHKLVVTSKSLALAKKLVSVEGDCISDVMFLKSDLNKDIQCAHFDNIGFTNAKGQKLDISAKSLKRAKKLVSEADDHSYSMNTGNQGIIDVTRRGRSLPELSDTDIIEEWTERSRTSKTSFVPIETASGKTINISSTNLDKAEKLITCLSDLDNDLHVVTNKQAKETVENTSDTTNSKLCNSRGQVTSCPGVPVNQMSAGGFQTAGGQTVNVNPSSFVKIQRMFSDIESEIIKDFGRTVVKTSPVHASILKAESSTLDFLSECEGKNLLTGNKGKQLLPKGFRPFKAPRIMKEMLSDSTVNSAISEPSSLSPAILCTESIPCSSVVKDSDSLAKPLSSAQSSTRDNTGTSFKDANLLAYESSSPVCLADSAKDAKHSVLLSVDNNINKTVSKVGDEQGFGANVPDVDHDNHRHYSMSVQDSGEKPNHGPANISKLDMIDATVYSRCTSTPLIQITEIHNVIEQELNKHRTSNEKHSPQIAIKSTSPLVINTINKENMQNKSSDNIRNSIEMDFDDLNTQQWMSEIGECDSRDTDLSKATHRRLPERIVDQQATSDQDYQRRNNNVLRHLSINQIQQARVRSAHIPNSYNHPQLDSSSTTVQQRISKCIDKQPVSHVPVLIQPPIKYKNKDVAHPPNYIQSDGSRSVSHQSNHPEFNHVKSTISSSSSSSSSKNNNQYVNSMTSFSTASGKKVNISVKSLADANQRFNDDESSHSNTAQIVTESGDFVVPQCDVDKDDDGMVHCVSSAGDVPHSCEVVPLTEQLGDDHQSTMTFEAVSDQDLCISESSLIKAREILDSHIVDTFATDPSKNNLKELANFYVEPESQDCSIDSKSNIIKAGISPPLCHKGALFHTASGKDVHVSSAAIRTVRKTLICQESKSGLCQSVSCPLECSQENVRSEHPDDRSTSVTMTDAEQTRKDSNHLFQTASGKSVKISRKSLNAARTKLKDSANSCTAGTSASFLQPASGQDVSVCNKALNAAHQTLHGDVNVNSYHTSMNTTDDGTVTLHTMHVMRGKEKVPIFQTASGNHVEISTEALSAIRKQIDPDVCDERMANLMSPPRTCSNKDVEISVKMKSGSNEQMFDVRRGVTVPSHISDRSNCPFQTASGSSVGITSSCLMKARYVLSKDCKPVTNSVHERQCLPDQSVPIINQYSIKENTRRRAAEFTNHQLSIGNSEQASLFQTASGHSVEISRDALRSVRKVLEDDVNSEVKASKSLSSGQSVSVSKPALDSVRDTLNNQERISDNITDLENTECSLFQTASGQVVEVSRDALKNVKQLFADVNSEISPAAAINTSVFQTASGHSVGVSKSALDSVRVTLSDEEGTSCKPIPQSGNIATGYSLFQTASGSDVSLSTDALAQVKLFLNKNGTDVVPNLTATFNFNSTNNNSVANSAIVRKPQGATCIANVYSDCDSPSEVKDQKRHIGDSQEHRNRCCDVPPEVGDESLSTSSQLTASTSSTSASEMQSSSWRHRTPALKMIPYRSSPQGCLRERPSRQGHVFKPVRSVSLAAQHISDTFLGARVLSPTNEDCKTNTRPFARGKARDLHGPIAEKSDIAGSVKPAFQTPYKIQSALASEPVIDSGNSPGKDGSPPPNTRTMHGSAIVTECEKANQMSGMEDKSDKRNSTPGADKVVTNSMNNPLNGGDNDLLGNRHPVDCDRTTANTDPLNTVNMVKGISENSACKHVSRDNNNIAGGFITDSVQLEWESARMRQDKEIRLKKKQNVRPLSGKLWSQRQNMASRVRLTLEDVIDVSQTGHYQAKEFYSMGVQRSTLNVRASNAELYKFNLHHFYGSYLITSTDGVIVGDGVRLIPDNDGTAGKYEFYRAFISASGVDAHLISEAWLYNHYKWIVWKLAAYEFIGPLQFAGRSLTPDNVMLQLKFRYDKEIDHCHRSALRKIYERDDTPAKRLILCVSALIRDTPDNDVTDGHTGTGAKSKTADGKEGKSAPQTVLELTDGWYSIKACLDPVLENVISTGRISVGDKLCTCGAELTGSEAACTPLESPDAIRLKIHSNSTRRARWDAKLGYQQQPRPMCLPLSSLRVNGGTVGCVDVVIVRVYPELYMERCVTGGCVFRNRRTEMRSADEYKIKQQNAMEELYRKIEQQQQEQQDKDKGYKDSGRRCGGTKYTKKQIESLHTGAEIYDMMNNVLDPDAVQCLLNRHQLQRLHDHQQELMDRKRRKLEQEFQKALQDPEQVYPARNVVPLIKIRLAGCHQTDVDLKTTCILTMWRPSDVTSILCEGKRFRVTSLSATQNRSRMSKCAVQLTALRGTRFTEVPVDENFLDLVYEPREVWKVKDLLLSTPLYDEVDFVGFVLSVSDRNEKQCQMVYACDSEGDVFAVRFWDGLKSQSLDDLFQPKQTFAAMNLILRQSRCRTRIATLDMCTERSQFTQNPSSPSLKHALTQLKQSLKEPDFLREAQLRLEDVSGITLGSQTVKTPKHGSSSGNREHAQPLRNLYTTPVSRRSASPLNTTATVSSPSLVTSCGGMRTRPDSPIMPLNRPLAASPMNTTVRIHSPPIGTVMSNNNTPLSRISGIRKRKQQCSEDIDCENVSHIERTNDKNISIDTSTPNNKLKCRKFSSYVSSPALSSVTQNNIPLEEVEKQTRTNHSKCAKLSRYGMAPVLSPLVATVSNSVKKAFRPPRKL